MSKEVFANNATTTLGSALSSGATSLTVATGTGSLFPTLGPDEYFTCTLWAAGSSTGVPNEIVKVTARSGDTFTIVRAQEGTTAQSWGVGDTCANYPTAAFLNNLSQLGLQSSGQIILTTTQTLSSAQAGANLVVTTSGITLTFPAGVTETFSINNQSSGVINLSYGAGTSDFKNTLNPGEAVILASDGNTPAAWHKVAQALGNDSVANTNLAKMAAGTVKANITGGTANPADVTIAALLAALGFESGSNVNGYWCKIPNGSGGQIIRQWGHISAAHGEGPQAVTFPIEFTDANSISLVGIGLANGTTLPDAWLQLTSGTVTISGASFYYQATSGGNNLDGLHWQAEGI